MQKISAGRGHQRLLQLARSQLGQEFATKSSATDTDTASSAVWSMFAFARSASNWQRGILGARSLRNQYRSLSASTVCDIVDADRLVLKPQLTKEPLVVPRSGGGGVWGRIGDP